MNFLAHLWLAERTGTSLAGAVLGDVARGTDLTAYPQALAHGIRVHRRVDATTDRHIEIVRLREGFAKGHRRYAGIVLDLAADYALAQDWLQHHATPLEDFCMKAAAQLEAASDWFVLAGGRPIQAQAFSRLLLSYATTDGIDRALQRTAARLRDPAPLLAAGAHWPDRVAALRELMPRLLADLRSAVAQS